MSARRRSPLPAVGVLMMSALFLAGTTPGDVGGCGGNFANTAVPGLTTEEAEYEFFDQGLCANLCLRLRECGLLCQSFRPGSASRNNCDPNSAEAYVSCVRGEDLDRSVFNTNLCPHTCGSYLDEQGQPTRFAEATEQDVAVCGRAIQALRCGDSLAEALTNPPSACIGRCQ
ncbi:MAG: hypothetical protein R3A48_09490 [Polyangiales bacterium]